MATLAHALQIVGGFIAPLLIFLLRRESRFVSFHALQVLLFHVVIFVVWVPTLAIFFSALFASAATHMFATIAAQPGAPATPHVPTALFAMIPIFWLLCAGVWLTELLFAIVYAVKAGQGEWAEYPLLGGWARRILKF